MVIPNPRARNNLEDCNPLQQTAATTSTVKAKDKEKLNMVLPQRLNEVTLHNRYSILLASALNETIEDKSIHESNDAANNKLESNINSINSQKEHKRREDTDQLTTSKQDNKAKKERSSIAFLSSVIRFLNASMD